MFDNNSNYSACLTRIYNAYGDWVTAFSNYLDETKEIRANYNQVAQYHALEEQRTKFAEVRNNSVYQIQQAGEELCAAINENWRPNPQSYITKAIETYSSEFLSPTVADLEHAAEDYGKNGTMLCALYNIAKKRGIDGDIQRGSPLYHADRREKLEAARSLVNEILGIMNTDDPIKFRARQAFLYNFEQYEAAKLEIIGNI